MMAICTGSSTTSNAISLHLQFKKAMLESQCHTSSISDTLFKIVKDNVVSCVNFHDILHCNKSVSLLYKETTNESP